MSEESLADLRVRPAPCLRYVRPTTDLPGGICRKEQGHDGDCLPSRVRRLSYNERALIIAVEDLLSCLAGTEHCDPVHGDSLSVREARKLLTRIREEQRQLGGAK